MNIAASFEKARQVAEKIAKEEDRITKIVAAAIEKAEKRKLKIASFWDDLQLLIQMVRAYFSREYTPLPWKTIVFVLAALVYFVNPLDAIPDIVPVFGFLDDATVIAFVINAIRDDMEKFRRFGEA